MYIQKIWNTLELHTQELHVFVNSSVSHVNRMMDILVFSPEIDKNILLHNDEVTKLPVQASFKI